VRDGLQNLRVSAAVNEAVRSGAMVDVPLD